MIWIAFLLLALHHLISKLISKYGNATSDEEPTSKEAQDGKLANGIPAETALKVSA